MRCTAARLCQTGDFIERWVSRARFGQTAGGHVTRGDRAQFTPQMMMRGSPYPKFPAHWGVPQPSSAIVPRMPERDMPHTAARRVQDTDLDDPEHTRREVNLPGKAWHSELPQDPVDRLFFQVKESNSHLLKTYGTPDNPEQAFENTVSSMKWFDEREPLSQMCLALQGQRERRERFITVMVTDETKQIARLLLDLGFISGMRDYNNGFKFSIETRWWDNRHAIENMGILSNPVKESRWWWDNAQIRQALHFNKVYNVIRIYFIRLGSGEIVTHPDAVRRGVDGGEPLCFVD
eukprot:TRINITY_DN20056_c0_g1_i1.p1 TRINITY_DN20056_c0_g1~~TRINITY_DN20056_c0_g1_i1.p1  ORF type:complete len:292 (+),score=49.02 TRINITY_DN20056_c0_g1_i1:82-957(+)